MRARHRTAAATVLAAGLLLLSAGCHEAPPPAKAPPAEVVVTTPITDQVTDYQDFTGRLDAVKTVDVRARVTGYVNEVAFKEGDEVKEGDLLFQIDSRTYQADYNQTVANYNQAVADLDLQEKNVARVKKVIGTGAITQEEYDTTMGAREKSQAAVGAAIAARDHAKLYLDFCRVTSSATGRISRRYVDPGNLVMADNTILTTIVTQDPMWAYFDVDERTYLDLVGNSGAAMAPGAVGPTGKPYPVWMQLANETEFAHAGTVNFVDNRLNGNSGTIRLRGVFDNPNHTLKPGLFVRIRLPIGNAYSATLIPDEAIMSDQGKKYVYVVNGENTVEYRPVELGQAVEGLRVIKKGVAAGDRIIVSGMQRVKAKSEVAAKLKTPPQPPSANGKRLTYDLPANRRDVGG